MTEGKGVCIVGSGNWGSVIARIVGENVKRSKTFANRVNMYVYEEKVDGRNLSDIINTDHENVKYLPGYKLPENVVAVTDVVEAAKDADILIFVVPHQFVQRLCTTMKGHLRPNVSAISLIKGVDITPKGLELISDRITEFLGLQTPCSVLMGANIASDVAKEDFCEATIGCHDTAMGALLTELFQRSYFRVELVDDVETVELCGALKNIVATGAGFVDGLGQGNNTKAAVIRLGLMEMIKFCEMRNEKTKMATFMESCGVADLITTCYSGRNRRVAEAFVTTKKSIEELETEMLNGQKLQGPPTAAEVYIIIKQQKLEARFPLFTAIHRICVGELPPEAFIDCLKTHWEHINDTTQ